jgi:hypothetical protein
MIVASRLPSLVRRDKSPSSTNKFRCLNRFCERRIIQKIAWRGGVIRLQAGRPAMKRDNFQQVELKPTQPATDWPSPDNAVKNAQ